MEEKETGVIITTMNFQIQLPDVDTALAGTRIRSGTISAGYSQVMPSHPTAKHVLNAKRNTIEVMPPGVLLKLSEMARTTMQIDIPVDSGTSYPE